ncbi:MAG TPA: protein kinase [Gammaproteobacteria bacterium]
MRAGAPIAEPDSVAEGRSRPLPAAGGATGPFRVVGRLGSSTVCEVWHARDASGRDLALKVLKPQWATPAGERLLEHEHAVLARLDHPAIVRTHGLVRHAGRPALALELLEGGDLVPLAGSAPRHWLDAAGQALDALRSLHAAGWAHRDVKARNVLLDGRGRARLVDFASAARLGAPRPRGGTTAAHARPRAGTVVDAADDAWAFAVLLYELLHGRLPAAAGPGAGADEALVGRLFAAVTRLLDPRETPAAGSLCALANVIESVIPRT